jgi:hypothetical protein
MRTKRLVSALRLSLIMASLLAVAACSRSAIPPADAAATMRDGASAGVGDAPVDQRLARADATADVAETCGAPTQPCCAANACRSDGCCVGGSCLATGESCIVFPGICAAGACGFCGGLGQRCCMGSGCTASGSVCADGTCVPCGAVGQACCYAAPDAPPGSAPVCTGPGATCDVRAQRCVACGAVGAACCDGHACAAGACCSADVCVATGRACARCGAAGQPCCAGGSPCAGGSICSPESTCRTCGSPGEPCCADGACSVGTYCSGGECVAPGTVTCPDGMGGRRDGPCSCGQEGQPCCPGPLGSPDQGVCAESYYTCLPDPSGGRPTCRICGNLGTPCCADKKCRRAGVDCLADVDGAFQCSTCGGSNERCCANGPPCLDPSQVCDDRPGGGRTCGVRAGSCGVAGALCCAGLTCTAPETVCVGNDPATATCQPCGRANSTAHIPCCAGNRCVDGSCCVHVLTTGVGPACIGVGDACWGQGSACNPNGSCEPGCGGRNQPCCHALNLDYCSASGTVCLKVPGSNAAACVPCGQAGQPCCQQVASTLSIEPCERGLTCRATPDGTRCGR